MDYLPMYGVYDLRWTQIQNNYWELSAIGDSSRQKVVEK